MKKFFDPITLNILWQRLISIVDEADASVSNTAFSSLLRDAHDYTCMFTDSNGNELVQGSLCTPGQAGAMTIGIKKIVTIFRNKGIKEGDIIILNDPWLLSGHLNDVCIISPIFFKNKLISFTSCIFHHSDIGGRISSDNKEVFEEGLFIPPIKLYEKGNVNKDLIKLIRYNVRTPDAVIGDIRSQIASNHVCAKKLTEMMIDENLNNIDELGEKIISKTENSMENAIKGIPNGVYSYNGLIEGTENSKDILICTNVKIKNNKIDVDLQGTAHQVDWGVNVVYNFTYAYVFMAIKSAIDPMIPINEGAVKPINVYAPKGSILNCNFPASVAARMQVGHFMTEMVLRAISKAIPKKVIAGCGGTPAQTNIFYGKDEKNESWLSMIIRGGGMGANIENDGHHCAIFPANGANTPIEIIESETPLLVLERSLITDSGGPGKTRGGLGRRMVLKIQKDKVHPLIPVSIGVQAGRFKYSPKGIFGGKNGSKSKFLKNGVSCNPNTLTTAYPEDKISFFSPGGGGYGEPFERNLVKVKEDIENGYISIDRARKDYGVIINRNLNVNIEATKKYRKKFFDNN